MTIPKNDYDALVKALRLAVNAPTEVHSARALELAEGFASSLNEFDIERAKREAKEDLD